MFDNVRFRRSLAAVITVVLLAAVGSAVWPRHGSQTVAAAPTSTSLRRKSLRTRIADGLRDGALMAGTATAVLKSPHACG